MYGFLLVFFSNFVPKTHGIWDIQLQKCRDIENRVIGPSRSLEMSPCDRAHMTSYWRSIVTMARSRVVSEIFNVEKCRDQRQLITDNWPDNWSGSEVTQGHWKWYHSIECVWFLLVFFSNCVPKTHRFCDIWLVSIPWPWNPGSGSLKVIENDTIRSGIHKLPINVSSDGQKLTKRC